MTSTYEDGARAMREAALALLPEQAHCSVHAEGEYLCMPCTVRSYTVDAIAAAIRALPLAPPAAGETDGLRRQTGPASTPASTEQHGRGVVTTPKARETQNRTEKLLAVIDVMEAERAVVEAAMAPGAIDFCQNNALWKAVQALAALRAAQAPPAEGG